MLQSTGGQYSIGEKYFWQIGSCEHLKERSLRSLWQIMSNPDAVRKSKFDVNRYNRTTAFPAPEPDSNGMYECIPCDKLFGNLSSYNAHGSTHTNCSYTGCGYQASAKVVAKHYRAVHGQFVEAKTKAEEVNIATAAPTEITKYFCEQCSKVAYSVEAWNSHLLAHSNCNLCSFSASKKVVEKHSLEVHNTSHVTVCELTNEGGEPGQYECGPCSISFFQLQSYHTHCSRHLKCSAEGCDFVAVPKIVANHFVTAHSKTSHTDEDLSDNLAPNKHYCVTCNKVVYSASAYAAHLATHTNCPICGYEAASQLVEKHQVVHTVASLDGKFRSAQATVNVGSSDIEIHNKKAIINTTPEWMTQGHFVLDGLPPRIMDVIGRLYPPFMILQNDVVKTIGKRKVENTDAIIDNQSQYSISPDFAEQKAMRTNDY